MFMRRYLQPFRRLQWKLTFSYTLTSVVTFLLVEMILATVIVIVIVSAGVNITDLAVNDLQQEAAQATPYFVHGTPDREAVTAWLQLITSGAPNTGNLNRDHPIFLAVVNTQGQTIASIGTHPVSSGALLQTQLSRQTGVKLRAVLAGSTDTKNLVSQENDGTQVDIAPIKGQRHDVQGALVMKIAQTNAQSPFLSFLQVTVVLVVIVTTIAAIAGTVFGYLTARGLTRRLKRLSLAADRWSHGDFSVLTHDTSADELGQLVRQLNRMAEQLQNLLKTRQELATLEERNRLARDLHDSVKQQIFAVSMQIGATKVLLKRDADAAQVRLNEAERLVHQAQQELTSLIRELRPVALEGKGLVAALRELVTQWAQQTDIVANLRVEGEQVLPLTVEEAVFRVTQEALSNVARHSKATLVQLTLNSVDDTLMLSIVDNGQGFDVTHGYPGVGLLSMQERMKALGGDVQLESEPGKGTRITVHCKRLGVGTGETVSV